MGLEPFDSKQTKWDGLWWHPEYNGFSSGAINLSDIRKFKGLVRLYVRKNKYYSNGQNNRPNYVFCLKDANASIFHTAEIVDDDDDDDEDGVRFSYEELQDIINRVACCVGGDCEYGEHIVSDFTDKFG